MSLSAYEKLLQDVPKKYTLLRLVGPPIYMIELSNNQLIAVCYYKDGSSKRHQINADFSNRRMVIADFLKTLQVMTDLLLKFPKHSFGVSAFAIANVTEDLLDGLTPTEVKAIKELIHVASSQARRSIVSTEIRYHGDEITGIKS